jgi:hypothetical protein
VTHVDRRLWRPARLARRALARERALSTCAGGVEDVHLSPDCRGGRSGPPPGTMLAALLDAT